MPGPQQYLKAVPAMPLLPPRPAWSSGNSAVARALPWSLIIALPFLSSSPASNTEQYWLPWSESHIQNIQLLFLVFGCFCSPHQTPYFYSFFPFIFKMKFQKRLWRTKACPVPLKLSLPPLSVEAFHEVPHTPLSAFSPDVLPSRNLNTDIKSKFSKMSTIWVGGWVTYLFR